MITLRQAITVLKAKTDHLNKPVHFVVLSEDGEIIAMDITGNNLQPLFKALADLFPKKARKGNK